MVFEAITSSALRNYKGVYMSSELGNLETTVTGKIKRFNSSSGFYYTTIVSPAADVYSFPL